MTIVRHTHTIASMKPADGRVREVTRLFLRLGVLGFGGPAAHIAMMRDEVVTRKGWVDDDEFLDLVGAKHVHRGQHLMGGQLAFGVLVCVYPAQRERRVGRLGAGVGGEQNGGEGRNEGVDLHVRALEVM